MLNLLTKGSEKHCTEQLRKTLDQHLEDIDRTVKYALDQGLLLNVYLEDWSNGYRDSRDYVYKMVEALSKMSVRHIMLPDTLGVMSPSEVSAALGDMC